jgi:hypothetical protein
VQYQLKRLEITEVLVVDVQLHTPILFLIFNRPDTTAKVFAAIREARPAKLYVAADGPRTGRQGEEEQCRLTREIATAIDWECELHTIFREHNLGCKDAVNSAITWFFEQEEEGIILEDDCHPHPDFFPFCEKMLEKYRNDEQVMMIGGTNYLLDQLDIAESYCFSRYFPIWGWASWRRAWDKYDLSMKEWPRLKAQGALKSFYSQRFMQRYVSNMFEDAWAGHLATWDIQWFYSCLFNNALSIIPRVNLISNIGFVGTHTSGDTQNNAFPVFDLPTDRMIHPAMVSPCFRYDVEFFSKKLKLGVVGLTRKVYFAARKRCRNAVQALSGRGI